MENKRVNLADVAKLAGVSSNTVSRVVRGDQEVSSATRTRVSNLIDELGYRPNIAARALAANRTGVLHILLAVPMLYGHAHTFVAMINAASAAGYHVSVSQPAMAVSRALSSDDLPPIDVDGVIVLGGQEPAIDLAVRLGAKMPTVLAASGQAELESVSTVSVDNLAGVKQAVSHLGDQGADELIHIAGPTDWRDGIRRAHGFVLACEELGISPRIIQSSSWDAAEGYEHAMAVADIPQGVFAANDQLALGAMLAMHERGILIPAQTRVVGFDDIQGAECYHPPLSSVAQPFSALGQAAVELACELIDGRPRRDVAIEPKLVIRASSVI